MGLSGQTRLVRNLHNKRQIETNPCGGYLHAYKIAAVTFGLSYAGCARIGWRLLRGPIHSQLWEFLSAWFEAVELLA